MTIGKRVVSAFVAGATILWAVGLAAFAVPSVATAATGGDLIKGSSLSTLYYYGYDGSRYTFPNEKTYKTWFEDFSGVTTLSDSALSDISLGGNVVYRPGSYWIKIQSNPKTYAVAADGTIHWVETEAVATDFAGSDWNQHIHDVPDTFFVDYTEGVSLMSATAYEGMMYMDGGDYYVSLDGEKRMVSAAGRSANDMMADFFLDGSGIDDSALSAGDEITGALCDLQDAAQTGGCSSAVVAGGDVTVYLASSTPVGATVPKDANAVDVLSFNVTAGSEAAELNTLTLTMDGIGATTNIDNVYLYEGSTRLTDARSVNASTRQSTFGALNYEIAANTTKTLTVRIEVASGASAGDEISFEIDSADDITLDGTGDVGGTFPVGGNIFEIANTSGGSVVIADNGTIDNPSLGAQDAKIGQFKITASSEDANLEEITLKIDNAADHGDFQLYDDDTWLATGEYIGDKLVAFDLSADPFFIQDGNSNIFKVTADIGGEAAETISVYLDNAADLVCIGGDYGFGMGVTYSGYDGTTGDVNTSTIQGGEVTMTLVGPTAGEIMINSQDQVLLEFTMTSAQDVTVKDLDVIVYGDDDADNDATDATEGGTDADATGLIGTAEGHLTDIKIINADTGSVVMGPLEFDDVTAGDDADQTIDFTDDFSIAMGETLRLQVVADIDDSMTSGTEFAAAIDISTSGGVVIHDANGDALTNSTDLVPTSNITGYNQEALAASLDLSLGSTPGDVTTVHGADDVFVNRFNISAGDAGSVDISSITMTVYSHTSATGTFTKGDTTPPDVNDYIESCSLYDVDDNLLDGPTSPSSNGQTITFGDVNWTLEASENNVIDVHCNFANPSATTTYYFTVDIDDVSEDIVAENENGTDVDPPSGDDDLNGGVTVAAASNVITVEDVGTLAVAKDSSTPSADILTTGSSDNHVATFRYSATYEGFYVDTLTIGEEAAEDMNGTTNSNAYANNIDLVTIEYTDDAGTTQFSTTRMSGNEAKFTGLDMYVDVNDPSKVKVYVDVPVTDRNAGGAATSNEYLLMGWMIDASGNDNFSAVGEDSGFTYTDTDSDGSGTDWTEVTNTSRFVVKETRPTLSLSSSSPSGSGFTPGDQEVLRFNVAAHSNEDVIIDQMMFSISSTDNASVATGWNECDTLTTSDFDLYNMSTTGTGTALDVDGDWAFHIASGAVSTAAADIAYVSLGMGGDLTTPIIVPANTTYTFALYIDSTGASASADDAMQVGIPADPILAAASFLAASDLDDALAVTATTVPVTATAGYSIGDIVCLDNEDDACDADDELALVTATSAGVSLTVIRGYLGTTPVAAGVAADDVDRMPSTLFWQDDGDDGTANSGQMWGSYLVDSLPITGGTMGF
ncbi:hypothetical protein KJ766_02030 [Patescibacteria group bacterium]|nr:hypothetical protein [Patescibacteria group bacterium]